MQLNSSKQSFSIRLNPARMASILMTSQRLMAHLVFARQVRFRREASRGQSTELKPSHQALSPFGSPGDCPVVGSLDWYITFTSVTTREHTLPPHMEPNPNSALRGSRIDLVRTFRGDSVA